MGFWGFACIDEISDKTKEGLKTIEWKLNDYRRYFRQSKC
jgi:hypothetical protein